MTKGSRVASPTFHATAFFTLFALVALAAAAILLRVEIVARGDGRVIPTSRVQIVQPEFGGRVVAIHVRDGDKVARGATLIELDDTSARAELNTLETEAARLEIDRLRIEATIAAIAQPAPLATLAARAVAHFAAAAEASGAQPSRDRQRLMVAELTALRDELLRIEAQQRVNDRRRETARVSIARVEAALAIQSERMDATQTLLERGAVSRRSYLDMLGAMTALRMDRYIEEKELARIDAEAETLTASATALVSRLGEQLVRRDAEIDARLLEIAEGLKVARRRLASARLPAPMDGTIDQLAIHTVGGVVNAGDALARLVPANADYEIVGAFPNADVGFLAVGQSARVRLDAFPAERFGALSGRVADVSADAVELEPGVYGYIVRIRPAAVFLRTPLADYPLHSGMTASVDVVTGDRRLIGYFIDPIVRTLQESLGER